MLKIMPPGAAINFVHFEKKQYPSLLSKHTYFSPKLSLPSLRIIFQPRTDASEIGVLVSIS